MMGEATHRPPPMVKEQTFVNMKRARSPSPEADAKCPRLEPSVPALLPELWRLVIEHLPIMDRAVAALVCKAWQTAANDSVVNDLWMECNFICDDQYIWAWRGEMYALTKRGTVLYRGGEGGRIVMFRHRLPRWLGGWSLVETERSRRWLLQVPRSYRRCYYCRCVFRAPEGILDDGRWFCRALCRDVGESSSSG